MYPSVLLLLTSGSVSTVFHGWKLYKISERDLPRRACLWQFASNAAIVVSVQAGTFMQGKENPSSHMMPVVTSTAMMAYFNPVYISVQCDDERLARKAFIVVSLDEGSIVEHQLGRCF